MAEFGPADAKRAENEGGYANNVADTGGETWAGIAFAHHPTWPGWVIVHAGMDALGLTGRDTLGTMATKAATWKRITVALAGNAELRALVAELYRQHYWKPLALGAEPDQGLADMAYDKAVNMGVNAGKVLLAEARKYA